MGRGRGTAHPPRRRGAPGRSGRAGRSGAESSPGRGDAAGRSLLAVVAEGQSRAGSRARRRRRLAGLLGYPSSPAGTLHRNFHPASPRPIHPRPPKKKVPAGKWTHGDAVPRVAVTSPGGAPLQSSLLGTQTGGSVIPARCFLPFV